MSLKYIDLYQKYAAITEKMFRSIFWIENERPVGHCDHFCVFAQRMNRTFFQNRRIFSMETHWSNMPTKFGGLS